MDFYAAILYALQGANWQRAAGKGEQPEFIQRPSEDDEEEFSGADELEARKKAFYDAMEQRRNMTREEGQSG